jgi:hypothetical protein
VRDRHSALAGGLTVLALLAPIGAASAAVAPVDVAPAAPQAEPVVLDGVHAAVRWRTIDPAVTRVVVRRTAGTAAPGSPQDGDPVFDGSPDVLGVLQVVTDTVVVGRTYTYGYWSFDAGGLMSAEQVHSIRATAAALVHAPALASDAGIGSSFDLSWGNPANPTGTPYTVKYATSTAPTSWVIWLLDTTATHAVFGAGASPIVAKAGATYRFEVLSQDPYGNDTRHALATVVEPYDTRSAALSKGWRTLASTRRWGRTVAVSSTPGARMTFTAVGTQVTVVADRCPGCGKALLTIDGKVRAVLDTHEGALSVRQQVGTVSHLAAGMHTVVIQVVGTTGHPAVQMDGVAVLD